MAVKIGIKLLQRRPFHDVLETPTAPDFKEKHNEWPIVVHPQFQTEPAGLSLPQQHSEVQQI